MNKARRKNIQDVVNQLEDLKSTLEDLQGEEEEYRDNIPENLQGSERYEKAEEACDTLSEAVAPADSGRPRGTTSRGNAVRTQWRRRRCFPSCGTRCAGL